jgi:hypothetical protein
MPGCTVFFVTFLPRPAPIIIRFSTLYGGAIGSGGKCTVAKLIASISSSCALNEEVQIWATSDAKIRIPKTFLLL